MKTTLTTYNIIDRLRNDKNAKRTYEEAKALANYYEELEESMGEEIELDVVSIRCEWSSYTLQELYSAFDHNGEYEENKDLDGFIEHLQQSTTVIKCDDTYLVMDF